MIHRELLPLRRQIVARHLLPETAPATTMGCHESLPAADRLLTPQNLLLDFGGKAAVTRDGVRTLFDALDADQSAAWVRWMTLFGRWAGRAIDKLPQQLARLANRYGIAADGDCPDFRLSENGTVPFAARLLFAVQTYYALLVNQLAERFGHGRVDGSLPGNPFCWCDSAQSTPVERLVEQLGEACSRYQDRHAVAGRRRRVRPVQAALSKPLPATVAASVGRILHARLAGRPRARPGRLHRPARLPAARSGLRLGHVPDDGAATMVERGEGRGERGEGRAENGRMLRSLFPSPLSLSPLLSHRRFRPESAGRDDGTGELLDRTCRRAAGRRAGGGAHLSLRFHPRPRRDRRGLSQFSRAPRRSRGTKMDCPWRRAVRFRRRQSAVDRLGQPARRRPPGDQAAVGALRAVFSLRQRGPARRRQERPLDADALRRGRPLFEARAGGSAWSSRKPSSKPRGPATVFAASASATTARRCGCSASTTWWPCGRSATPRIGPARSCWRRGRRRSIRCRISSGRGERRGERGEGRGNDECGMMNDESAASIHHSSFIIHHSCLARPIDPAKPTSPWLIVGNGE